MLTVLLSFGSKLDLAAYGKRLRVSVSCLGCLSLLFLVLSWQTTGNDFAKGFLLGLVLSLGFGSLYYGLLLRDEDRLKAHYTKTYDERYQRIQALSALVSLAVIFLIQTVLIFLAVFWHVEIPYLAFLIGSFYVFAALFLLVKSILDGLL